MSIKSMHMGIVSFSMCFMFGEVMYVYIWSVCMYMVCMSMYVLHLPLINWPNLDNLWSWLPIYCEGHLLRSGIDQTNIQMHHKNDLLLKKNAISLALSKIETSKVNNVQFVYVHFRQETESYWVIKGTARRAHGLDYESLACEGMFLRCHHAWVSRHCLIFIMPIPRNSFPLNPCWLLVDTNTREL